MKGFISRSAQHINISLRQCMCTATCAYLFTHINTRAFLFLRHCIANNGNCLWIRFIPIMHLLNEQRNSTFSCNLKWVRAFPDCGASSSRAVISDTWSSFLVAYAKRHTKRTVEIWKKDVIINDQRSVFVSDLSTVSNISRLFNFHIMHTNRNNFSCINNLSIYGGVAQRKCSGYKYRKWNLSSEFKFQPSSLCSHSHKYSVESILLQLWVKYPIKLLF